MVVESSARGKRRLSYTGLCGAALPSLKEKSESSRVHVYTCEDLSACLCTRVHAVMTSVK